MGRYDRRSISLTVPTPATSPVSGTLNLRGDFAQVHQFVATNVGSGTSTKVKLTDGLGRVFFLHATAVDLTSADKVLIGADVTETGLFYAETETTFVDATGTAATIAGGKPLWVANPITVSILDGTLEAADVTTVQLYYSYGDVYTVTVPTIATTAATTAQVVPMPIKYGTLLGFSALNAPTSTTQKVKITDADSNVIFLDAAATDYATAELDRLVLYDDTLTGLTWQHLDATGAAATATSVAPDPIFRSPLTVTILEAEEVADTVDIKLWVKG